MSKSRVKKVAHEIHHHTTHHATNSASEGTKQPAVKVPKQIAELHKESEARRMLTLGSRQRDPRNHLQPTFEIDVNESYAVSVARLDELLKAKTIKQDEYDEQLVHLESMLTGGPVIVA